MRLTLYKHWNVEDSVMHSSYFYGALELNREKGLRTLKHFFANMGIPPAEYPPPPVTPPQVKSLHPLQYPSALQAQSP